MNMKYGDLLPGDFIIITNVECYLIISYVCGQDHVEYHALYSTPDDQGKHLTTLSVLKKQLLQREIKIFRNGKKLK